MVYATSSTSSREIFLRARLLEFSFGFCFITAYKDNSQRHFFLIALMYIHIKITPSLKIT